MHSDKPVAIIGSGHTPFGRLGTDNLESLIVAAAREALADADIPPADVDQIYLGHFNSGMVSDGFASSLVLQAHEDLRFKPAARCENACASGAAAIFAGLNAICSGAARVVLVVGAEKMTSRTTEEVTAALAGAGYQHDAAERGLSFPQLFALAAQAYGQRWQDPLPAMAAIAAKNHRHALRNPLAQMQRELSESFCNTVSDKNPLIAPPLRMTDCSLITDGAAAIVLAAPDVAAQAKRSALFRAAAHVSDRLPLKGRDLVAFEGPRRAFAQAYAQAGVGLDALHFAEVHDCFTIAELLIYEAMGLAAPGQAPALLAERATERGGRLPVNLSGGLKAKGHPVGATGVSMHALAFRQLTGQAGDMQLPRADLGLVFNMGGAAVASYATILQTGRA